SDVRTLIQRYAVFESRGKRQLETDDIEEIVRLAQGLPWAATMAVGFLPRGVRFRAAEPQVKREIVRSLLENMPDESFRATFRYAATLRWFNEASLHALASAEAEKAAQFFANLHRWPFIEERVNGWAVNDTIRVLVESEL